MIQRRNFRGRINEKLERGKKEKEKKGKKQLRTNLHLVIVVTVLVISAASYARRKHSVQQFPPL